MRAEIEARDESATYDLSGFRWFENKWGALSVYAPTDGDDPEIPGKIVGFEWWSLHSTPVYVTVAELRQ